MRTAQPWRGYVAESVCIGEIATSRPLIDYRGHISRFLAARIALTIDEAEATPSAWDCRGFCRRRVSP